MSSVKDTEDRDARDLLDAAQGGDERALGRLLVPHWRGLKLFCGLMLGDAADADRAITETVLAARSEVGVVACPASVRMWIHRIAARICLQAVGDGPMQNDQPFEAHTIGPCARSRFDRADDA